MLLKPTFITNYHTHTWQLCSTRNPCALVQTRILCLTEAQYLCLFLSLSHLIKNGGFKLIATVLNKQYISSTVNSILRQIHY
jgi:hypothetical protein